MIDVRTTRNLIKTIREHLDENRVVITLCDEIEKWHPSPGKVITFLGQRVPLDNTIGILIRRLKVPVVFGLMLREKKQRYKFIVTSKEDMEVALMLQAGSEPGEIVLKFLEKNIYRYPANWYLWKNYWILEEIVPPKIGTG